MRAIRDDPPPMHSVGVEEASGCWYRRAGSPSLVLAPMVDQSEMAFRALCRSYGCTLAVTPMFNSRQFSTSEAYRREMFGPLEGLAEHGDRPLLVQFAGNEPATMAAAARHVQHRCDAVDVNLGCPQKIARRGRYGAWLLDEWPLLREIVGTLRNALDCPVTCKVRLLQSGDDAERGDLDKTLQMATLLRDAGASLITVHGRTREQKGRDAGPPDWPQIAALKQGLGVPLIANGGVFDLADARRCLDETGADGACGCPVRPPHVAASCHRPVLTVEWHGLMFMFMRLMCLM